MLKVEILVRRVRRDLRHARGPNLVASRKPNLAWTPPSALSTPHVICCKYWWRRKLSPWQHAFSVAV